MNLSGFDLLGHDCPFERYPSPVIAIGMLDGRLVAVYPVSGEEPHLQRLDKGSSFMVHSRLLNEKLRLFDHRLHNLFAWRPDDVDFYDRELECDVFIDFLTQPEFAPIDPLLRVVLAERTGIHELVVREKIDCAELLGTTPPASDPSPVTVASEAEAVARVSAVSRGRRILIVDDYPAILKRLQARFGSLGYDVVTALNGLEALEKIYREKPDVVLLDLRMPKCDGFEVIRVVKQDPAARRIPIIVLSALTSEENQARARDLGASIYLSKMAPLEDVQAAVLAYSAAGGV